MAQGAQRLPILRIERLFVIELVHLEYLQGLQIYGRLRGLLYGVVNAGRDQRRRRDGYNPGDYNILCNTPTDLAQALRRANPHDGGTDNLGGAHRAAHE